jgi:hypothetical protein
MAALVIRTAGTRGRIRQNSIGTPISKFVEDCFRMGEALALRSAVRLSLVLSTDTNAIPVALNSATSDNSAYVHRLPSVGSGYAALRRAAPPHRPLASVRLGAASHTCDTL